MANPKHDYDSDAFYALLERAASVCFYDKDVAVILDLDEEVDKAIAEYNTQTHRVMHRPNKSRRNQPDFITNKLPRNRQQYINEVELFFLLGNPIQWKKGNDADDEAYRLFTRYLQDSHFNARMRQAKRLAGPRCH